MKKRIISLLLTVAMLISVLPIMANADTVETTPFIKSASMSLDGILGLNIKVDPGSVSDMSGYTVKYAIGDETSVACTEIKYDESTNLWVYTAKIPAHKLHNTVAIELLDANSETVDTKTWTLDDYLASIVAWDSGLSELAGALDLYAKNAADYAADSAGTEPATAVEQAALEAYKCESVVTGDVVPSAVLLLDNACTLRVQISADKWADGYSLKIGGEEKTLAYNEEKGIYYYDIEDIRAQDWGTKYQVVIVDAEDATLFECNYAVLSYVYTVLGNEANYTQELNLLKSMFLYYQGAVNYDNADRFDYSLTYNANYEGSEETKVESATITATSKNYTVVGNPFYRPGYRFTGWNTAADGTGTSYDVGSTLTLKAVDTLMYEDFIDNVVSNTWTQYENGAAAADSVWSAADGTMKYTGTSTGNNVLIFDTAINADNYEITAQIIMPASGNIGLVFAASEDHKDHHYFRIMNNNGNYTMYAGHQTNGVSTNLNGAYGSKAAPSGANLGSNKSATLKVVVNGTDFSIYANDVLWLSGTTSGDNLHGKVGLFLRGVSGTTNHSFDDVVVSAANMSATLYAQWEKPAVFEEDFNDNTVSSTWTQYDNGAATADSVWSAADGVMKYIGTNGGNSALMFDTPVNADNYEITTQVTMHSNGGSIGLIFAANDNLSNFHYFRIWYTSGNYRMTAGHDTSDYLQTMNTKYGSVYKDSSWTDIVAGNSVTLKVVVEGQNFSIYANDHLWMSGTTTGENLHGKIGLLTMSGNYATGHSFDDVSVSVPNILVSENFNNNKVFSGWMQYDNNVATSEDVWSAADGVLKYSGSTAQNSVLVFDTEIKEDNYEFSAQVLMPSAGSIGLVFAANDDLTDFHYFRIWTSGSNDYLSAGYDHEDGLVTLNSAFAGSANKSCSDIAANQSVVLKVVVNGQDFSIYAGSTLLLSGKTTRENLHGKVGLFLRNGIAATSSFDDVLVVKTEAAVTE